MDLGIAGKRALVTGASAGIGHAVAHVLAAEGARLVIAARNLEKLTLVRDEIAATGAEAPAMVTGDLSTADGVGSVAQTATAQYGGIDILVNNAGASRPMPKDADDAFWEEAFALNFSSARRMTEALLPGMRTARWGRVVNISGALVQRAVNAATPAKVALVSWSRSLASEVAPDGVTVNCVAPGRINSDQILNRLFPTEESRAGQIKDIPMGRFGEPQELADLVAFLVSDRARYITGVHVPVDGGMVRLSVT
ncbi:MAG: SDR family oxidoreductase [Alphaproteobacteria bacterium]|jgi:3-oxoacyl-[acyl-carrier protein] reductase|nr:SDR family oxidoreductase [Alphaproteobacteria bacterium]